MDTKSLYEAKEILCKEIDKIIDRRELNPTSLDNLYKLIDSLKNIYKIEMYDEDGQYSSAGNWEARGEYGTGSSYARRGEHYVRGHYSRDNGRGGYSNDDGYSSRRMYSRDDGRNHIMSKLEDMMRDTSSEKEREAIKRCLVTIENA